jgi:hypothetical protein
VVFLVQVVPELARAYSPALLAAALWLPLFSLAALFVTGCSDPGIIPRIPPPEAAEALKNAAIANAKAAQTLVPAK